MEDLKKRIETLEDRHEWLLTRCIGMAVVLLILAVVLFYVGLNQL